MQCLNHWKIKPVSNTLMDYLILITKNMPYDSIFLLITHLFRDYLQSTKYVIIKTIFSLTENQNCVTLLQNLVKASCNHQHALNLVMVDYIHPVSAALVAEEEVVSVIQKVLHGQISHHQIQHEQNSPL